MEFDHKILDLWTSWWSFAPQARFFLNYKGNVLSFFGGNSKCSLSLTSSHKSYIR